MRPFLFASTLLLATIVPSLADDCVANDPNSPGMNDWCHNNNAVDPSYCPASVCHFASGGGGQPSTTQPASTPAPDTTAPSTNPPTNGGSGNGFARFFDESQFKATFPSAISLYTFQGLVNAAAKYPSFANTGDDTKDKQELAAFLAQTAHESDQFKAAEEYAKDSYPESQYCDPSSVPCAPGHRYHGRGPIQLSWNYNYNAAGKALGLDLLNQPELVGTDKSITWQTALWYWMTPQKAGRIIHNVVTQSDGFAQATDIINGGLECHGGPSQANEQSRINYYKQMCQKLGVSPVAKVSCN